MSNNTDNQEKIILIKKCKFCNSEFNITDKDRRFYERVSPILNGKKYNIPFPNLCVDCRNKQKLAFRNERNLYKRKCDLTGKEIISIYNPDRPGVVYDFKERWTDKWEGLDYGQDFDFDKNFFNQFHEVLLKAPKMSVVQQRSENSDYANESGNLKNCYLCFSSGNVNDSLYVSDIARSERIVESTGAVHSTIGYNLINCNNCYHLFHSIKSDSCKFSYYLYDCNNCKNCFMCVSLKNKQYCILNEQYTKEEYKQKVKKIFDNLDEYLEKYENLIIKTPKRLYHGNQNDNSTGDLLFNTKNCQDCFEITESKDLKNCIRLSFAENCMDVTYFGFFMERCYMCLSSGDHANNLLYSISCFNNVTNLTYCVYCVNCQDCFGCVSLKDKKYCILNKQYTKEEYEELVPKIISHMEKAGEWGEFFPYQLSPFGYNQSAANSYYPLDKQQALEEGFNWSDYETPAPNVEKIIPANKLPKNIKDIPDDILNWAIKCEITNKPYRIVKQELDFYRKYNLPIPKKHPDQRYLERIQKKNPRKIFDRNCAKCGKDIQTSYPPNSSEIVYCSECYNKEFY